MKKTITVKKNDALLHNAKNLRRQMTKEERKLWYEFLREYPIKIYKQRIIDNFVADFYCDKARLVIELDGSQHYNIAGEIYDKERTRTLERYGLLVLRFSNLDVINNFYGVCQRIDEVIKERIS